MAGSERAAGGWSHGLREPAAPVFTVDLPRNIASVTDGVQIPGIVITLKDVYEEQRKNTQELTRQISEMTTEIGRFSGQLAAMDSQMQQGAAMRADHEARLRALERWRYALPLSTLTAAGALGLALASYLHH